MLAIGEGVLWLFAIRLKEENGWKCARYFARAGARDIPTKFPEFCSYIFCSESPPFVVRTFLGHVYGIPSPRASGRADGLAKSDDLFPSSFRANPLEHQSRVSVARRD